jgi:putative flavoprotein involved in K+ transport
VLRNGYDQAQIAEVDIEAAGISAVIWAIGYRFDFGLVKLPVTDGDGFPVQQRGVTAYPGLYFVGMPWLHTQKSGLLVGVGDDAAHVAAHIAGVAPSG